MTIMVFLVALLPVVLGSDCKYTPFDCSDIYNSGEKISGIYPIYPVGNVPVWVYCDMISDGNNANSGGWTVIQRRMDGSVNFYRPWDQYKRGFGNVESEYWLGLENMYKLTLNRNTKLRVDLEDFLGNKIFPQYSSFSVGPETEGYKLHVSGYSDGGQGNPGEPLTYHNGQKFSTFDKDQDNIPDTNCARKHLGAFWYDNCLGTNPNGVYLWGKDNFTTAVEVPIGTVWKEWKGLDVSLKTIIMKIKRVS